ncbi:MAG: hypothetical protein N3G21_01975 [Candidatus Hydrogenedentes bacterium]|nr:hypothetical protein [Candidatus Hydrogenedentota bacterium]
MIFSYKNFSAIAIDFGSEWVKIVIGDYSPQQNTLVIRTHGTAPSSSCVSKGLILDVPDATDCLGKALSNAGLNGSSNKNFPQTVIIGFEHPECETAFEEVHKEFKSSEEINESHIKQLKQNVHSNIRDKYLKKSLHTEVATYEWYCDGERVYSPLGMRVKKISLKAYLITVKQLLTNNHSICVTQIPPFDNQKIIFHSYTPIASIFTTLSASERALGSLIIDFGKDITSLVLVKNESILFSRTIDLGIKNIIPSVTYGFDTKLEDSKKLVFTYGISDEILNKINLVLNGDPQNISNYDFSKIPSLLPNSSNPVLLQNGRIVQKTDIEFVITVLLFELFHKLCFKYIHNKNLVSEFNYVYLIGGGSLIPNLTKLVETLFSILKIPKIVKIGYPLGIQNLPSDLNSPLFTPVLGLLKYSYLSYIQSGKNRSPLSFVRKLFPSFIQNMLF